MRKRKREKERKRDRKRKRESKSNKVKGRHIGRVSESMELITGDIEYKTYHKYIQNK